VVLSKPAGLLSQGEHTGDANVVDWLRARLGRPYVGLVHRLDRNTSGAMVVAKRTKAAQRLTAALQEGTLQRTYLGWLNGTLERPSRWSHVLEKDERTNRVRAVRGDSARGKAAALSAVPLARSSFEGVPVTLVEFTLETGRSHQIRAQALAESHPLLGDVKYAARSTPQASARFGRPALHSWRVSFPHPISGDVLSFEAPLPAEMAALLPPELASRFAPPGP
jgi:RluA family pseudouridine synthase